MPTFWRPSDFPLTDVFIETGTERGRVARTWVARRERGCEGRASARRPRILLLSPRSHCWFAGIRPVIIEIDDVVLRELAGEGVRGEMNASSYLCTPFLRACHPGVVDVLE